MLTSQEGIHLVLIMMTVFYNLMRNRMPRTGPSCSGIRKPPAEEARWQVILLITKIISGQPGIPQILSWWNWRAPLCIIAHTKAFMGILMFSVVNKEIQSPNGPYLDKYLRTYEMLEPDNPDLKRFKELAHKNKSNT